MVTSDRRIGAKSMGRHKKIEKRREMERRRRRRKKRLKQREKEILAQRMDSEKEKESMV